MCIRDRYDAAKEAQGLLEMKINKLKQVIADAKIIVIKQRRLSPILLIFRTDENLTSAWNCGF